MSRLAEVDAHEGPVYFADEDALCFTRGLGARLLAATASPVGSRRMTASYPRDPVIAVAREGFGSLLVHGTARHLGLDNREITIFGTNDDSVATDQQDASQPR